jgi:hypothetical protein
MLRTRFSLWRSQAYWRILCAISKQFREFADTSKALAASQMESRRWKAQYDIVAERLSVSERDRETAQRAAQNATDAASHSRAECDRAQRGEIEALRQVADNLKVTVNYAVYASGSQLPMFDGVGPTKPVSKWDPAKLTQMQGPKRSQEIIADANREFFAEAERRLTEHPPEAVSG